MLDFMEPHIWMAAAPGYYEEVGYNYERFDLRGYANLVDNAKRVYLQRQDHWNSQLAGLHRDVRGMVAGDRQAADHDRVLGAGG